MKPLFAWSTLRPISLTVFVVLFFLMTANARAQTCQESLKSGLQNFVSFHQDPDRLDQAIAAYQTAAATPECAYDAQWRLAELYLNHGTIQTGKAKKLELFKLGQEAALKAIELKPGSPEGHYFYAVNLGSQIELEGVMKNIFKLKKLIAENDKAISINPNFSPALIVKARFMADLPGIIGGNDEKAEELFKKALKADPNCEVVYIEYASFLGQRHRLGEANALLDAVSQSDFKHTNVATWLLVDQPSVKKLREKLKQEKGK